jgi:hypothetical protein
MPKAVDVAPPPVEPTPIPRGSNLPAVRKPQRQGSPLTGWAILMTIVILVVGGFHIAREKVVEIWPHAERLYAPADALFGKPNRIGITIQNVKGEFVTEDGQQVLVVKGELKSIAKKPKPIPRIRIDLRDKNNKQIFHWTFSVDQSTLEPGQTVAFSSRLPDPPEDLAGADATFDTRGDNRANNN